MVTKYTYLKNVNNYKYIHGDFDKDGIPNIDDKYPFNPKKKEPVNPEIRLSSTFHYIDKKRKKAKVVAKRFAKKEGATSYRVKDTYSVINKSVRRNPYISNDFVGFRFEKDVPRRKVEKRWVSFNKKHHISKKQVPVTYPKSRKPVTEYVGADNKYVIGQPYKAYHSNFILGKQFGAEFQFRTKKMGKVANQLHPYYKNKKKVPKKLIRFSDILYKRGF